MVNNNDLEKLNSKWNVNTLRFTLFPSQPYSINEESWKKIFGNPPDSYSHNIKNNKRHYEGEFGNGVMNLDLTPMRVDFNYVPKSSVPPSEMFDLSLGPVEEVAQEFIFSMNKFLEIKDCPFAQRIAFAPSYFMPTETRMSGYKLLDKYLPKVEIDPENSSDFLYQINRARESKVVNHLLINRLTKWRVVQYQSIIPQNMKGVHLELSTNKEYSLSLEMDINSQANYKQEFDLETQRKLFNEFIELSREILSSGDVS